jgi:hypothetical protein
MLLDFLDGESNCCIKQILLLILLLQYYNSICNRHYLLCQAVVDPRVSPWRKLYEHADNSSFLHMTGLNHHAFRLLLEYLFDDDVIIPCRRRGLPCSLGPEGYLGLLLFIWEAQCNMSISVLFLGSPCWCGARLGGSKTCKK